MVRSQPSRTRTLQTLTGPHPRPGHKTPAQRRGSPGHGRLRGHIPGAWAGDSLGSALAPVAARAPGAPLSGPPSPRPLVALPLPGLLRPPRSGARVRGLAPEARRSAPAPLPNAVHPRVLAVAATERRRGCLGNRGLGWSDWRREPGRGRRLRRQQGSNTARPRHGVGEGVAQRCQGARVCSCREEVSQREGVRWGRTGAPGKQQVRRPSGPR